MGGTDTRASGIAEPLVRSEVVGTADVVLVDARVARGPAGGAFESISMLADEIGVSKLPGAGDPGALETLTCQS